MAKRLEQEVAETILGSRPRIRELPSGIVTVQQRTIDKLLTRIKNAARPLTAAAAIPLTLVNFLPTAAADSPEKPRYSIDCAQHLGQVDTDPFGETATPYDGNRCKIVLPTPNLTTTLFSETNSAFQDGNDFGVVNFSHQRARNTFSSGIRMVHGGEDEISFSYTRSPSENSSKGDLNLLAVFGKDDFNLYRFRQANIGGKWGIRLDVEIGAKGRLGDINSYKMDFAAGVHTIDDTGGFWAARSTDGEYAGSLKVDRPGFSMSLFGKHVPTTDKYWAILQTGMLHPEKLGSVYSSGFFDVRAVADLVVHPFLDHLPSYLSHSSFLNGGGFVGQAILYRDEDRSFQSAQFGSCLFHGAKTRVCAGIGATHHSADGWSPAGEFLYERTFQNGLHTLQLVYREVGSNDRMSAGSESNRSGTIRYTLTSK